MRALRVVGVTEDGHVVLEDPARRERFTVPADEQLRAAARGDLTRLGQIAIELESQLRPREIQARIRAGASVEQVASAAGVPLQKIERFAYPVLLERSRTAELAQGAHPLRADGPDVRTLGEVVAHTFGLRGQDYLDAEWDSWKGEDGKWVVALCWRAGRSDNEAHWTFQPGAHGGTVTAIDEHASDLVEGLPMRPLRTVGPVIDIGRPEEQPPAAEPVEEQIVRAAASGSPVRERPADRSAGRPSVPPEQRRPATATAPVVAPPRPPERPPERPAERSPQQPAERAPERPAERSPERPAEPPAETTPPEPPGAETARPEPAAATTEPAPAAEQTPAESPVAPAQGNRRTKKGKPVVPSWDEVLLGVRGQR
ncbi:septation protein SepH [Pseudonocardia sp. H11422]|uniref:septation protein SepH n=1 Tax=Pseudonocardia sp. H11422 TaxID=2835866 RepID=UPI001BDD9351|nr:septation protein SepH [Pseudonocardia sp. H11422]